jgi:tetratricopeptide (TPR) repeat protein
LGLTQRRGEILRRIGESFEEFSQSDSARSYYEAALASPDLQPGERALILTVSVGASPLTGETVPETAITLLQNRARNRLNEARMIASRIPGSRLDGEIQLSASNLELSQKRIASALDSLRASAQSFMRAGAPDRAALALSSLGNLLGLLKREWTQEIDAIFLSALQNATVANAPRVSAEVLLRRGDLIGHIRKTEVGLADLRKAAMTFQSAGDAVSAGLVNSYIADAFDYAGEPDSAIYYWKLSDHAKNALRAKGVNLRLSADLNSIAYAYAKLLMTDSALVYARSAIRVARESNDAAGERFSADLLWNIYRSLNRADSAKYYAAIAKVAKARAQLGRVPDSVELQLEQVRLALEASDTSSAVATIDKLLSSIETTRGKDQGFASPEQRADVFSLAAELSVSRKDFPGAVRYAERSLSVARTPLDSLSALLTLVEVHLSNASFETARSLANRSLELARRTRSALDEALALELIGAITMGAGAPPTAMLRSPVVTETLRKSASVASAYFDSAFALMSSFRTSAGSAANRIGAAEAENDITDSWVMARLLADDAFGALAVSDMARANELVPSRAVDVSLAGDELSNRGRQLVKAVTDGKRGVIAYHLSRGWLVIWVATPDGRLRSKMFATGSDSTALLVAELRSALAPSGGESVALRGAIWERSLDARGAKSLRSAAAITLAIASRLLPSDLVSVFPPHLEIIIVPQGILGLVPFGALQWPGSGTPLGVRNALRMTPTLRLAAEPNGPRSSPNKKPVAGNSLVVGDPLMPRTISPSGVARTLPALPGSQKEARAVAVLLSTSPLMGARASEKVVRQRMGGAAYIHFATHAIAFGSLSRARESGVAFAAGEGFDGFLTVGELEDDPSLSMHAELVVLSACETGFGETFSSEGTIGIQRAFLKRGAKTVLVSLWAVDDRATGALMTAFYSHLFKDPDQPSKAEALRRSISELREKVPLFSDPYYWSGFQLVGQP